MTAGFCGCKRFPAIALAVGALVFSGTVQAQVFRWVAVPNGGGAGNIGQTSADCTVFGDTITCPGGGRIVQFSIGISGWGDFDPDRELGTFQATLDGTSYTNGSATLNPLNYPAGDRTVGAYQVLSTCFNPGGASDGLACGEAGVGPFGPGLPGVTQIDCQIDGGLFCLPFDRFLLTCCNPIAAVSAVGLNYSYGATTGPTLTGRSDDGTVWYGGELVLEIPAGASGTWDIAFLVDSNLTFMYGFSGPIGDCSDPADCLQLLAGHVVIPTGNCCSGNPVFCTDDLTLEECGSGAWQEGGVCQFPGEPDHCEDCGQCIEHFVCDDGNACTNDTCLPSGCCAWSPDYDTGTECCDPATGATVLIDDGVECTDCSCDGGTPVCVEAAGGTFCDDDNACTDDSCTPDGCRNVPSYDEASVCCNPSDGSTTFIDDRIACTDCVCDPSTGVVTCGASANGTTCNDSNRCTVSDVCAAGVCGGTDVGEIPCASDEDCPRLRADCDIETGYCVCRPLRRKMHRRR